MAGNTCWSGKVYCLTWSYRQSIDVSGVQFVQWINIILPGQECPGGQPARTPLPSWCGIYSPWMNPKHAFSHFSSHYPVLVTLKSLRNASVPLTAAAFFNANHEDSLGGLATVTSTLRHPVRLSSFGDLNPTAFWSAEGNGGRCSLALLEKIS